MVTPPASRTSTLRRASATEASNRQIAGVLGVDRRTVDRDFGANVPPAEENDNENNTFGSDDGANAPPNASPKELTGEEVAKLARRAETRDSKREERLEKIA